MVRAAMSQSKLAKRDPAVEALQKRQSEDIDYHLKEWSSGTRGGGSVPADLTWGTNPKLNQEENGAAGLKVPYDLLREGSTEEQ